MSKDELIRVGMIDFLNGVVPDYQLDLPQCEKFYGMPSVLNNRLRSGELDISPVSSMEYLLHYSNYEILPKLCIRADRRAATVGVFSSLKPDQWHKRKIYLSGASLTSVYLLKLLCKAYYKVEPLFIQQASDRVNHENLSEVLKTNDAMLVIGDRAYKEQKTMGSDIDYYDLAEAWREWTGLPFIFALWLVRNEVVHLRRSCVAEIHRAFLRSISLGLENIDDICNRLSNKWPREQVREYFKVNLAYDLNEQAVEGLTTFIRELHRYKLIPQKVPLQFFHI